MNFQLSDTDIPHFLLKLKIQPKNFIFFKKTLVKII